MLGDLKNPKWIYAKGVLFLVAGLFAGGILLAEHPSLRTAFLLAVCVWCFCRAYYFAFYVIEHYVDPAFRFAGLGAFARYILSLRRRRDDAPADAGGLGLTRPER